MPRPKRPGEPPPRSALPPPGEPPGRKRGRPPGARGRSLPPGVIAAIQVEAARGDSTRQIADRHGCSQRAVQAALVRAAELPSADLPAAGDERLTPSQVAARVRLTRDILVDALESAATRLVANLRTGRDAKGPANAVAVASDRLRSLDAYLSISDVMLREIPATREEREAAYVRLLWAQAAAGSMPAAKQLARAWGIESLADRGTLSVEWSADDDDDGGGAAAGDSASAPAGTPAPTSRE